MVSLQQVHFSLTDTVHHQPVYHCHLDSVQLWLVHPLNKAIYDHPYFSRHFAEGFYHSLKQGYHPFDALVTGSIYASKLSHKINRNNLYHDAAFPVIYLDFPKKQQSDQSIIPSSIKKTAVNDSTAGGIGLYPIIDHSNWIKKLAETGISTIQLRIKNQGKIAKEELEQEVASAVTLARSHGIRLFVNDHWQLAIKYQAYGVHLGQEDLATADMNSIKMAGLQLGISTHCHFEVARALSIQPDYLAIGPVFATKTKPMAFQPQGLSGLQYWRTQLSHPLVAIAGIHSHNIDEVLSCMDIKRDGIAVISAITQADDPVAVATSMQKRFDLD